jgi:O-antigen/teichoic acid export membrane protein
MSAYAVEALLTPIAIPRRGLTANSLLALSGNLTYGLCQWSILLLLAKTGNPSMVGQFALGLAVTAPIFQFTNLQLRTAQVTDARSIYSFSDYLGLRLVASSFALIFVGLLAVFEYRWTRTATIIVLIGLAKSIESVSDTFQGLFQKHEEIERVAVSLILKGLVSTGLVGLGMLFFHNIVLATALLVVAWASTLAIYDVPRGASMLPGWRGLEPRFRPAILVELFLLTLPLGFLMMLLSLNENIPRYFLVRHGGTAAVGIYSALAYCLIAGNTLITAVAQAASPRLAKHYANNDLPAFRHIVKRLLVWVVMAGAAGIFATAVAGRQILAALYTPEYAKHADAFLWLVIAGIIASFSGVLGVAVTAMRIFKIQAAIRLGCTIAGLAACSVLIPAKGILGAAMAAIMAATAALAGYAVLLAVSLKCKQNPGYV